MKKLTTATITTAAKNLLTKEIFNMKKLNKSAAVITTAVIALTSASAVFAETSNAAAEASIENVNTSEFAQTETAADEILQLVNSERAADGLAPLTLDYSLSNAAMLKARDMADCGYFDHESPNYGTPFEMIKALGIIYRSAGENIAKGQKTAGAVMTAWMNSEGHRANILKSDYGKLGVGYVVKDGTAYWVQIFTD